MEIRHWIAFGAVLLLFVTCSAIDNTKPNSTPSSKSSPPAVFSQTPSPYAYTSAMDITAAKLEPAATKRRYIGPKSLNVRSSPNGKVIGSLSHGALVTIYSEKNNWSRISAENSTERWVSSEHLCTSSNCADKSKRLNVPPVPKPKSSTTTRRASSSSYTGGCPCSSGSNCYGPRGGRYCITSGGNKRYR